MSNYDTMTTVVVKTALSTSSNQCDAQGIPVEAHTNSSDFWDLLKLAFPNFFIGTDDDYAVYTSCGQRINRRSPMQTIRAANFLYILNNEFLSEDVRRQLFSSI